MQFIGTANKGIFHPADPFSREIFLHKMDGKKLIEDIDQQTKPTTLKQYGYLFGREGLFEAVSKQTGHTKLEVENIFKMLFHFKVIDWYDIAVRIPDSISRKNAGRQDLSELINNIRIHCVQNEIWTPEPKFKDIK